MKKILNPLSVIGTFCALIEAFAAYALIKLPVQFQNTFMWFIIILTFIIIGLFFVTLNFNSKVLYAPSDFREDSSYLEVLKMYYNVKEELKEEIDEGEVSISIEKLNQILESSFKRVERETKDFEKLFPKLMSQGELTLNEITEILGKSQSSSRRIIKKYVDEGTLISANQSGKTLYKFNREKFK